MKTLKTVRRVLSFAKPYRAYLLGALLCAVATVCLTLLGPVLVGSAIDFIIAQGQVDFESVGKILLGLLLAIAGTALFQWLMTLCTNAVSYYTVRDLRQTLFQKLNAVPLKYIDAHPHGDLISRVVNDIDAVGDGLLQGITQLFSGLITIIGTLAFMLAINYRIAVVVVLVTPLSLFVAAFIARLSAKMFKEQQQTQGEIGSFIEENIGGQKVVKAFSRGRGQPGNLRRNK